MGVTLARCVIGNFESSPVQAGGAEAGRCDRAYGECGLPAPGNLPGLKVNPLSLDDGAWLGTPHFTARVTQSLMGSSDRMVVWHPPLPPSDVQFELCPVASQNLHLKELPFIFSGDMALLQNPGPPPISLFH